MARSGGSKGTRKRDRKKREQLRIANGAGSFARIGKSGGDAICYVNADWKVDGRAAIHVLRRKPGGGHADAHFLVDIECLGLKEAFGSIDITHAEFEGTLEHARARLELKPVELEFARRLVAGGIRVARENGFRLPPRYQRWTALLGDLGEVEQADISDFGVDGKWYYCGPLDELRKRLTSGDVDEFLRRADVEVDLVDDWEEELPDEPDEELDEVDDTETNGVVERTAELIRSSLTEKVRQFCFARGEAPSARIGEAWDVVMESILQEGPPEEDEADDAVGTHALEHVQDMLSFESQRTAPELMKAMAQVQAFIASFESPAALSEAIGLDEIAEEVDNDPA